MPRVSAALMTRELHFGFADILVCGDLTAADPAASTLVVANHTCGWDLRVARWLTVRSGLEFVCFTNPSDLQRQPRLAHLGLRAIPRDEPLAAATVLREEGKRLAAGPGRALWVFPQGGYCRMGRRPVVETGVLGVRAYARSVNFVSVAMHYEFYGPRRAWAWLKVTPVPAPEPRNADSLGEVLHAAHQALLADLRDGTGTYRPILRPGSTVLVMDGVPVDLATVNEFLELEAGTRGCRVVSDPSACGATLTGRPVSTAAVLSCLQRNLGRAMAELILDNVKRSSDVGGRG
jgi:hypothetical protein